MSGERVSLVRIGRVGKPHGVKGEVKIVPEIDDAYLFDHLKAVWLGADTDVAVKTPVSSVRFQHSKLGITPLVAFEGIPDRNAAERIRNQIVFVPESTGAEFIPDTSLEMLRGMSVLVNGEEWGSVLNVYLTAAHPVLEIKRDGNIYPVPLVDEFIKEVDQSARTLTIEPIPGLLGDNAE